MAGMSAGVTRVFIFLEFTRKTEETGGIHELLGAAMAAWREEEECQEGEGGEADGRGPVAVREERGEAGQVGPARNGPWGAGRKEKGNRPKREFRPTENFWILIDF